MSDTSERRKQRTAEQTLRENEEQLRLLLENMQDVVSRHLPDSTFIYVSPSCQALIGYTPEELVNTRAADYVHPDDVQATLAAINEATERHDGHYRVQHRMKRKDGGYVWVETAGRLLYGTDGHLREIQCIVRNITQRKHWEEELRESEERFRSLFENAPLGYQSLDENGNFIEVNDTWCRLLGYTKNEVLGRNFSEFIRPDFKEHFKENFPKFKSMGYILGVRFEMIKKDGSEILVAFDGKIGHHDDGSFKQTHCVLSDVTERNRAEEALQLEKERAQSYLDLAGVMFVACDANGNVTLVNQKGCEVLGYEQEEIIGKNWFDCFLPASIRDEVRIVADKVMAGDIEPVEYYANPVLTRGGEERTIAWHNTQLTDNEGKNIGFLSSGEDITERKRAEEALLSEKLLSDEYINSLPGLFYVFDEQRFVRWNKEWERVTGYDAEELGARYGTDFFDGEGRILIEEQMGKVFRQGAAEAEAELVTKDGSRIPYYFTGLRKVFDGKEHLVGLGMDITDRKRAEVEWEKLIAKLEAQNAELERFTYTVSHDLKSPLITIKGYVGMLRQDLHEADSGPVADDLSRISNAADKMDQLLQDLLELSRIGRLVNPPEDVSLDELARQARELVHGQAEEAGVQVEISPDLPVVFGDRVRLLEVLQNLIDNAVKHMGEQSRPRIDIGSRRDGNQTVCYVRDNGIGIEPRYHEKIFGLFDQLDQNIDGSGIGLALARRIVEVHGGRIWVESEGVGHGSTFCFTIADRI